MLKGIDFAYGSGLTTAQIKAAGYSFVCRYLSGSPGSGKDISAQEILDYYNAGILVVFNWETDGIEGSEAAGVADATAAQAELATLAAQVATLGGSVTLATAIGEAPIIFSCDTSPSATVDADAVAYMRGVNSVIGLARSGGYGGYAAIQAMFNAGVITYGWQTYAWSNGAWDTRALLRQVQNSVTLGPAQVDEDEAAYWTSSTILGASDKFGQCMWNETVLPPFPAATGLSQTTYTSADFGWGAVSGATTYHFVVTDAATGEAVVNENVTSNHLAGVALKPGTYRWKVGVYGTSTHSDAPWSEEIEFTI